MKKNLIIFTILIVFIAIIAYGNYNNKPGVIMDKKRKPTGINNLAIMIENEEGNYEVSESDTWPTKENGYVFNPTLSKCENGGKLSWNEDTKSVVLKTSGSDKCYVYFDKTKGLIKNVTYTASHGYDLAFNVDIEKYTDEDLEMQYQVDGDKLWYHNSKNDVTENKTYDFTVYTLNAFLLKPNQEYTVNIRLADKEGNIVNSTSIKATTSEEQCNSEICANPNNSLGIFKELLRSIEGILSATDISLWIDNVTISKDMVVNAEGTISIFLSAFYNLKEGFDVLLANAVEISAPILQAAGPMTIYWYDNTTKTRVGDIYDFPMMLETPIDDWGYSVGLYYPYYDELEKLCQNLEICNEDFSEFTPSWTQKDYSLVLEFAGGTLKLKVDAA